VSKDRQRYSIVIEVVDSVGLERAFEHEPDGASLYREKVIRPVAAHLQSLCEEYDATLTNPATTPFIIEALHARQVLKITSALAGPDARVKVPYPVSDKENAPEFLQFRVGVSRNPGLGEDNFAAISCANALTGGAGPNQVYLEDDVAEDLLTAEAGEAEILFRGRHQLLEGQEPTYVFELRAGGPASPHESQKREIVRLTLVVIDIMHSTSLKPLMGKSQQERLENYNRKLLDPFRETVTRTADTYHGTVVDTAGDACFLSFDDPEHARKWVLEILQERNRIPAPKGYDYPVVKYHLSIDSGRVMRDAQGFLQGNYVDRVHRLNDLTHEDQIILSPPVATSMQGELADESVEGRITRHGPVKLQGIFGEVDIYEYCPPGVKPRTPRKGKGQVQLHPAFVATLSARNSIAPHQARLQKLAERFNGREAEAIHSETARAYLFDSGIDAIRFLLEALRPLRAEARGGVHHGLMMEKSGKLEGASITEAFKLADAADPGAVWISTAARASIQHVYNPWFKLQKVEHARVELDGRNQAPHVAISKLAFGIKAVAAVAALVILSLLILWPLHLQREERANRERLELATMVSLAPGLQGSWWFREMPWFTPANRLAFFAERDRFTLDELRRMKALLLEGQAGEFYADLSAKLATLDTKPFSIPTSPESTYQQALEILKNESLTPADWHLLGNLFAQLRPAADIPDDAFQQHFAQWRQDHPGHSSPDLKALANAANDYRRALFAFDKAREGYQAAARDAADPRILQGLHYLVRADRAQLEFDIKHYLRGAAKFDYVIDALEELHESTGTNGGELLRAYLMALCGESYVRLRFEKIDRDQSGAQYAEQQAAQYFDEALRILNDDLGVDRDQHPYLAMVYQRKAHMDLEKWALAGTARYAQEAVRTRSELRERENADASADSPGALRNRVSARKEYYRCRLLLALADHFSGNAGNAQRILDDLVADAEFAAANDILEGRREWQSILVNTRLRRADFYIFLATGKLEQAEAELQACLHDAEGAGFDQPESPYFDFYLLVNARMAWVAAIQGDEAQYERRMQLLESVEREPGRHSLAYRVATAFRDLDRVDQAFAQLVSEYAGKPQLTRDDRQVLLFLCAYLLLEADRERAETEAILAARQSFAEPWMDSRKVGSDAYLISLHNSAREVRDLVDRQRARVTLAPDSP